MYHHQNCWKINLYNLVTLNKVFILYAHPLSQLISSFKNIIHHLYAEDTQIYITITPENATTAILDLQSCLESVQSWMDSSKLKLNPDKNEFRNLGVIFDSSFRLSVQVSSICSSSYYHIQDFARIRRYLDKPTVIAAANALVGSRLDYCNSLSNSIFQYNLKRLTLFSICFVAL